MNSSLTAVGKPRMNDVYVLDASAILTVINGEVGAEAVLALLPNAIISAVNLSEVVAKLQEKGGSNASIDSILGDLDTDIVPFDKSQAIAAGKLRDQTRKKGLSFGDRACLALALARGATAVTADRAWAELQDTAKIVLIR